MSKQSKAKQSRRSFRCMDLERFPLDTLYNKRMIPRVSPESLNPTDSPGIVRYIIGTNLSWSGRFVIQYSRSSARPVFFAFLRGSGLRFTTKEDSQSDTLAISKRPIATARSSRMFTSGMRQNAWMAERPVAVIVWDCGSYLELIFTWRSSVFPRATRMDWGNSGS